MIIEIPEGITHFSLKKYRSGNTHLALYVEKVSGSKPIEELEWAIEAAKATQAMRANTNWKAELPKQERYSTGDNKDFIDESYETDTFEQFTAAMFWTIRKYMKRFGRKDRLSSESYKIMDYSKRFHEKVLIEEAKQNPSQIVDERV